MTRRKTLNSNDNVQIKLEPNKFNSLSDNLKAYNIDPVKLGLGNNKSVRAIDTRNKIIQSITSAQENAMDLINKNDPTKIPFLPSLTGNILINPSTVSLATLQKVAQNDIVARCLDMNSSSIYNSLGNVYHNIPEIEKSLRDNYEESDGGLRHIVECLLTADIFGFALGYIRDYIDDTGAAKLDKLDLLPPSTILFSATARGDVDNIFSSVYTPPYGNTQNLFSFPYFIDESNYTGVDPLAGAGNAEIVPRTTILNTMGLILLDKDKCIHYTSDNIIKVANPYGWNPLTRRVFDLVMLYDLYKQLQTTFLSYRACPLIVGYADNNQPVDIGDGITIQALDGLYNSLRDIKYNGALILSGKKGQPYEIDSISVEGDTKAFSDAIDWYAKQIEKSMGLFSNDESSYASATTQTSLYGRLIENKKNRIADKIVKSINRYFIEKNFGTHIKDYGYFENQVQNIDDQLKARKLAEGDGFYPNILKKDNDYLRIQCKQPLLTDEEFEEVKKANIAGINISTHPKDTSDKVNTQESNHHYKHAANGD